MASNVLAADFLHSESGMANLFISPCRFSRNVRKHFIKLELQSVFKLILKKFSIQTPDAIPELQYF